MKTYRQFILEANEQQELSQIRRLLRNPPPDPKKIAELNRRFSELTKIIRDKPKPQKTAKQKRQENAVKNTGYAQKEKDPTSSAGTVSGVRRRRTITPEPSDMRFRRYGEYTGGRGTGKSRSGGDIGR
jgi:hypothetical protein